MNEGAAEETPIRFKKVKDVLGYRPKYPNVHCTTALRHMRHSQSKRRYSCFDDDDGER